ncbi:MAG: glycoside hydrolase family 3 [Ruminococcus sp.]|nr:glycoside hydrolase family 3 [Ruminococcus sp.]
MTYQAIGGIISVEINIRRIMMSKKKKVKHSNIPLLLILLLITGACSIAAVYQYLKNRPAENVTAAPQNVRRESEKTSVSNGKQGSPDEKNASSEKNNGAETTQVDPEVKPAENASLSDGISDTKQDNSETEEASVSTDSQINELMANMTLHDKICQMFIVTPESLTGYDLVTQSGTATLDSLQKYPVGGLIYFAQNLEDKPQTKEMISATQSSNSVVSDIPLFISVDEEGGIVARCAEKLGTTDFDPMYTYRAEGAEKAYSNAYTIAQDIASLGFNLDFAPVADTWSNPDNTVIGTRAYSDDFSETATLVASAVKGFNDGGVACTIKHFPGHGDTAEDSHVGMACSYKTIAELEKQEYLAFESGIAAGADMVMVGHITMVNVDNIPSSLSKTFMTDELRGKLGFKGLIITDALGMGALSNYYSSDEIAVEVIKAGGDILLMPADLSQAVTGVENAVTNGEITEQRINESVIRILELKKKRGIL